MKSRFLASYGYMFAGVLVTTFFLGGCVGLATIIKKDPTVKLRIPSSMILDPRISTPGESVYMDSVHHTIMSVSGSKSIFTSVDNYLNCSWKDLDSKLRGLSEDSTFLLISCEKEKTATILTYSVSQAERYYPYCVLYFAHRNGYDVQVSFYFKNSTSDADRKFTDGIMHTLKIR